MILTCPSCGTQYVVKDGAVPPGGRQVRCTACKHSWHQDPETITGEEPRATSPSEQVAAEPPETYDEGESLAEATLIDPRNGPEAEERAFEEAAFGEAAEEPERISAESGEPSVAEAPADAGGAFAAKDSQDWSEPPEAEAQDDQFSPFAAPDEVEPRRRRPLVAVLIVALVVVAIAGAFWFLAPPEWKARLGLTVGGTSPLALVTTHMDRQRLESGNELLTVTGRVINPTGKQQDVPPIQAQLKTKAGKIVYSWTIAPPARSLPPGASASFNSAEVNVPPGGDELTISLGPPAG
jgi:predicted Zn finger-like uncharacterized protein